MSQFVDFQQNENNKNILFTIPITQPPWHNFEYIIVQNMTSSQVEWSQNDAVGHLNIMA